MSTADLTSSAVAEDPFPGARTLKACQRTRNKQLLRAVPSIEQLERAAAETTSSDLRKQIQTVIEQAKGLKQSRGGKPAAYVGDAQARLNWEAAGRPGLPPAPAQNPDAQKRADRARRYRQEHHRCSCESVEDAYARGYNQALQEMDGMIAELMRSARRRTNGAA